jgi:glycerol-3-phosphate acyltransferase PlsY
MVIALFFRYSSLAAIVSAVFAPVYYFFLFGAREILAALIIMSALLLWRHKTNILKLVAGEEHRIGEKRDSASA